MTPPVKSKSRTSRPRPLAMLLIAGLGTSSSSLAICTGSALADPTPAESASAKISAESSGPANEPRTVSSPEKPRADVPMIQAGRHSGADDPSPLLSHREEQTQGATVPDPSLEKPETAASDAKTAKDAQAIEPASAATANNTAPASPEAALSALLAERGASSRSLEQKRESEAIAAFYAARDFKLLWLSDGAATEAARNVIPRLAAAGEDGLDTSIRPPSLPSAEALLDPARQAAFDLALSEAVLAYGRQASGARIDPHRISRLIGSRPDVADASFILASVASASADSGSRLRGFNPQHPGYIALRDKLVAIRRDRQPSANRLVPRGPVLKVGMRDPRVALIRAKLSLDGRLDSDFPDSSTLGSKRGKAEIYDTEVAMAVADFQRANGLPASGQFTPQTSAILLRPRLPAGGYSPQLERELVTNMEFWRWMPRDLGHDRIEVNVPDFEVVLIRDDIEVARHRVVVGKTETPTPIFSHVMQFLIVNPYWNVPPSILKKEMLPKLANDPNYLHRLGYEVFKKNGRLVVRQPPGERNALGRIKFMFPNDYAVYLHDTPSRRYFEEDKRSFSHGCVRIDDPYQFAEQVLGPKWSEKRITGLFGKKERYINLPKPLPIHIEYFTASVDPFGHVSLRDDIYGYAHEVSTALGLQD